MDILVLMTLIRDLRPCVVPHSWGHPLPYRLKRATSQGACLIPLIGAREVEARLIGSSIFGERGAHAFPCRVHLLARVDASPQSDAILATFHHLDD
jgi:hypothetical protein